MRRLTNLALSKYSHPDVRRLAIERLTAGRWTEDELDLLKMNYEPGDAALIECLIHVPENSYELHRLGYGLVDLFESNPVDESGTATRFVYEQSPCSICRRKAVTILVKTGNAPGWLLGECRFDSDELIRAAVQSEGSSPA